MMTARAPLQLMPLWWAVFVANAVLLSWWLQGFRLFSVSPTLPHGLALLLLTMAGLALFMLLLYDGYVKEQLQGRLKNRVGLFDWLMRVSERRFGK